MEIFIHIDGDNVGNHIELLLMDGNLNDAKKLSNKIKSSFDLIGIKLKTELSATIHICAGDDIILSTTKNRKIETVVKDVCKEFNKNTGLTLSIGIGNSIESSLLNLRRAKISGRNKIVGLANNE